MHVISRIPSIRGFTIRANGSALLSSAMVGIAMEAGGVQRGSGVTIASPRVSPIQSIMT